MRYPAIRRCPAREQTAGTRAMPTGHDGDDTAAKTPREEEWALREENRALRAQIKVQKAKCLRLKRELIEELERQCTEDVEHLRKK